VRILGPFLCLEAGAVDRFGVECADPQRAQLMALNAGTSISHYNVTSLLDEGGMGRR